MYIAGAGSGTTGDPGGKLPNILNLTVVGDMVGVGRW